MSWNMKGTESNLGVKAASVKNNHSKFECLLEFTFICKKITGSQSFYHIYLIFQFIDILLYMESGAPEQKTSLIKICKKQVYQKVSVKQRARTTMAGLWVTESIFSLFTVVLSFILCVFIHVLYWFVSFWKCGKNWTQVLFEKSLMSSLFWLLQKIWKLLSLFTFEKELSFHWKSRSYTPVPCEWSVFKFCSSSWRILLGWPVIFQNRGMVCFLGGQMEESMFTSVFCQDETISGHRSWGYMGQQQDITCSSWLPTVW